MKLKESNLDRQTAPSMQSQASPPYSTRHFFQDRPALMNLGNNLKISGESKPPFVVRRVDSAKPFDETISELHSQKSRRKSKFQIFHYQ